LDRDLLEAQFWWAFSCLALAGCRNAEHFHAELLRRSSGSYPEVEEVEAIVREACCHLAAVLNRALEGDARAQRAMNGWERHLLALSMRPGEMEVQVTVDSRADTEPN
jgi:hypothetical protein